MVPIEIAIVLTSASNLPPEDNLQIKDKSPTPKVSFIFRGTTVVMDVNPILEV